MAENRSRLSEMREHTRMIRRAFGEESLAAVHLFEEFPDYPIGDLVRLARLTQEIEALPNEEEISKRVPEYRALRLSIEGKRSLAPKEKIMLWPEGNRPVVTEYFDNKDHIFNHMYDFKPYLYEMLVPEDVTPKGAVVLCAGGDHGYVVLYEAYQIAVDFNKKGYQCFVLLNRPNHNPWSGLEAGADAARAIRIVRANAGKYRISENSIAFAGFSNGGLTGEECVRYFGGDQKMSSYFRDYKEDGLDSVSGAMNAFLCIYGPRFFGQPDLCKPFDYSTTVYPPVFHATGLDDFNIPFINALIREYEEHGIYVEVHTFSGVPHGQAGVKLFDGYVKHPNFECWEILADTFMQTVYERELYRHDS